MAFQGISRLASRRGPREPDYSTNRVHRDLFQQDALLYAVRQVEDIPLEFRRSKPGTDIFVLGYRADAGWERRLIESILANFWPAIHRNTITFSVGKRVLDSSSLPADLQEFSHEADFNAHRYYAALIRGRSTRPRSTIWVA